MDPKIAADFEITQILYSISEDFQKLSSTHTVKKKIFRRTRASGSSNRTYSAGSAINSKMTFILAL